MARRVGRRAGTKAPGNSICIVTEGRVTEREYLEALRTRLGISKNLVHVDYTAGHNDIVSLAKYAIRKSRERDCPYEEWWVVADSEHNETAVRSAESLVASNGNIHLAISRPCFEIWPMLHLRDTTRQFNSSTECQRELDNLLPGYLAGKKHLRPYMPRLLGMTPDAVLRARRTRMSCNAVGSPVPTEMDLLVGRLNAQAAPGDAFKL